MNDLDIIINEWNEFCEWIKELIIVENGISCNIYPYEEKGEKLK